MLPLTNRDIEKNDKTERARFSWQQVVVILLVVLALASFAVIFVSLRELEGTSIRNREKLSIRSNPGSLVPAASRPESVENIGEASEGDSAAEGTAKPVGSEGGQDEATKPEPRTEGKKGGAENDATPPTPETTPEGQQKPTPVPIKVVEETPAPEAKPKKPDTPPATRGVQLPHKPDPSDMDPKQTEARRNAVRAAIKHAWSGYRKYAFGQDELCPLTNSSMNWLGGMGATIVDSLDTLWIAGLKEEFEQGREWVRGNLNFGKHIDISTFECNIRYVGGLLAAYDLSKDKMFLNKAQEVADRLIWAFNTTTGLPYSSINLFTHHGACPSWAGNAAVLSEMGTMQLEFGYLSQHTGNAEYHWRAQRVIDHLDRLQKPSGLYPIYIDPHGGSWRSQRVSMGALGDSFYEYLLKYWLLTGQTSEQHRRMYDEAMNNVLKHMLAYSNPDGLTYIAEWEGGRQIGKFDHLACFSGGMLALGAETMPGQMRTQSSGIQHRDAKSQGSTYDTHKNVGAEITRTCWEMYRRQPTGIGPEMVHFTPGRDFTAGVSTYLLRPETVESFFVLWRLTKDPKYREWGWAVFQAIETHCKTGSGYSGLRDVRNVHTAKDNQQQSFFLAETLKYLYLLFTDDSVIPLDKYVFNTEAHPLSVYTPNYPHRR